jgi:AraC family transcriptional regulator, melibiose operon regulatory protein
MKNTSVPEAGSLAYGSTDLTCNRRTIQPAGCVTHHAHIELNLIRNGSVTYLCGGDEIQVGVGRLVAFWSAIPHQIVEATGNAEYYAMTVPLAWFLQYRLAEGFTHLILDGHVLVDPQASSKADFDMFERWVEDLRLRQPARHRIVLLEVEARLLRFAEGLAAQGSPPGSRLDASPVCNRNSADRIHQMLSFIAQNYTERINAELISQAAGFHPNYAMNLFRKTLGTTLVNYVTRHRVSHAQRLLATTDQKVIEVSLNSGFNSVSRFNDAFKKACGCSPREYRDKCRNVSFN